MIAQETPNNPNSAACPDFMAIPVRTGGLHETWFNPVTEQLETFIFVPKVNGSLPKSFHFSIDVASHAAGQEDRLYKPLHNPKLRELGVAMEQLSNSDEIKITTIDSDDINNAVATMTGWESEQTRPAKKRLTRNRKTAVLLLLSVAILSIVVFFMRRS